MGHFVEQERVGGIAQDCSPFRAVSKTGISRSNRWSWFSNLASKGCEVFLFMHKCRSLKLVNGFLLDKPDIGPTASTKGRNFPMGKLSSKCAVGDGDAKIYSVVLGHIW